MHAFRPGTHCLFTPTRVLASVNSSILPSFFLRLRFLFFLLNTLPLSQSHIITIPTTSDQSEYLDHPQISSRRLLIFSDYVEPSHPQSLEGKCVELLGHLLVALLLRMLRVTYEFTTGIFILPAVYHKFLLSSC